MKLIFMGTPEFGKVVLDGLCKTNLKPVLVITAPNKPVGRKQILTAPPVKVLAESHKIPVLQPEKLKFVNYKLKAIKPDLVVLAAYGQILPPEILNIPKYGCLNIHGSLLPKYRGPSPIQSAILRGEKETGVSIILMDGKIDHGPILAQRKTIIGPKETAGQLHDRLAVLAAELLLDTVPDWLQGKIKLRPQDEKRATYTKILTREDGKISWRKKAEEIERQIRAFYPWPGSYTFWKKKVIRIKGLKKKTKERKTIQLKILGARLEKKKLIIEKVQPEGKKPMDFQDFLRGNPDFLKNKNLLRRILIR